MKLFYKSSRCDGVAGSEVRRRPRLGDAILFQPCGTKCGTPRVLDGRGEDVEHQARLEAPPTPFEYSERATRPCYLEATPFADSDRVARTDHTLRRLGACRLSLLELLGQFQQPLSIDRFRHKFVAADC